MQNFLSGMILDAGDTFTDVVPSRTLNLLYIILDICFLVFFLFLLVKSKKYLTVLFALAGGLLYFVVDYGIFYAALGTRTVEGANTAWFLLWLSMSYGITNFAYIWLAIKKDKHLLEWSILIVAWWIACPLISQNFGSDMAQIAISRGTGSYHGAMAAIMFVGYAIVCIYNIRQKQKGQKINIPWLLFIGISVQFAWEFCLLVTGVRAAGFGPLVVNSLLETNLGIPYIFFIYLFITKRFNEDLSKKKISEKTPALAENSEILEKEKK